MSNHNATRVSPAAFNSCTPTQTTPFEHSGPLGSLFENLSDGEMPNFLEMMAALSEIAFEMTGDSGPCFDCKRG